MNYIIREENSTIRAYARKHLTNNWLMVTLGVAVYILLTLMMYEFFVSCITFGQVKTLNNLTGQYESFSVLAYFYRVFFSGVFAAGISSFLISFVRRKDVNIGYIFNGFEYYLRAFALFWIQTIFVFLWTLLLVVPGFIALYRYSQAFYILADDPSKSAMQCLRESKEMMVGNKGKLFLLQLSFIGWAILTLIPLIILAAIFLDQYHAVKQFLVLFIGFIPFYPALTYMNVAETVFYELLLKAKESSSAQAGTWPETTEFASQPVQPSTESRNFSAGASAPLAGPFSGQPKAHEVSQEGPFYLHQEAEETAEEDPFNGQSAPLAEAAPTETELPSDQEPSQYVRPAANQSLADHFAEIASIISKGDTETTVRAKEEKTWFGLVFDLREKGYLHEFDPLCSLEEFKAGIEPLLEAKGLHLDLSKLRPIDTIKEWTKVLEDEIDIQGCLACLDVNASSYLTFVCSHAELNRLRGLASQIGQRIERLQNLK